jgi:hypothetical protein
LDLRVGLIGLINYQSITFERFRKNWFAGFRLS